MFRDQERIRLFMTWRAEACSDGLPAGSPSLAECREFGQGRHSGFCGMRGYVFTLEHQFSKIPAGGTRANHHIEQSGHDKAVPRRSVVTRAFVFALLFLMPAV